MTTTTTGYQTTVIASRRIGSHRQNGTEFPIETLVRRSGPRSWTVHFAVSNGIAAGAETFRTRRAALEAAGVQ
jgi:hypothetical protein